MRTTTAIQWTKGAALLALFALPGGADPASAAPQGRLMACESRSDDGLRAEISLEESGRATLKVSRGSSTHVCGLTLRNLADEYRNRSSRIRMRFQRGACVPALPAKEERDVMTNIPMLFVRGAPKAAPAGRLQWHWSSKTTPCTLRAYNGSELVSKAERFKLGSWGRGER